MTQQTLQWRIISLILKNCGSDMLSVSQYKSHQPKAWAGILTLILHMKIFTTLSFINEDKTVSMGTNRFQEYGPSEQQQGQNKNVTTSGSSDHNNSYCTMLTKWATIIADQNQTWHAATHTQRCPQELHQFVPQPFILHNNKIMYPTILLQANVPLQPGPPKRCHVTQH
jgi:hypothetical protein